MITFCSPAVPRCLGGEQPDVSCLVARAEPVPHEELMFEVRDVKLTDRV